jgi:hypothetical protein
LAVEGTAALAIAVAGWSALFLGAGAAIVTVALLLTHKPEEPPFTSAWGDVVELHPEARRPTSVAGRGATEVDRSQSFARHIAHDGDSF